MWLRNRFVCCLCFFDVLSQSLFDSFVEAAAVESAHAILVGFTHVVERGLGCVGAEGVGLGVGSGMVVFSSHGAVCFRSWDCSAAVLSAACRSHPRVNGFACSAFSLASRATSMIRCTSLTSRGGSVFHHSVRSASSRLASSSSSTGSGSGRRGSRPISRGTGSGLDSKLLPDVLLGGGRGRFDQLPATRRYGLAIEHSDSRNRLIAVSSSFLPAP